MFELIINKSQFDCLFSIINNIYEYRRFQYNYYETRKFQYWRPLGLDIINSSSKDKKPNKNAITLWRYAINMTVKKLKYLRGDTDVFKINKFLLRKWEYEFQNLFAKQYFSTDSLSKTEKELFKRIVTCCELESICLWTIPVIEEIYKIDLKKKKKEKQTSFFNSFFSKQEISDKELVSEEEKNKIKTILNKSVANVVVDEEYKKEVKFQMEFYSKEGSFTFFKYYLEKGIERVEGFSFHYRRLEFLLKNGLDFFSTDAKLFDFNVNMLSIINDFTTTTPITLKSAKSKKLEVKGKENESKEDIQQLDINTTNKSDDLEKKLSTSNDDHIWKAFFRKNSEGDIDSVFTFEMVIIP